MVKWILLAASVVIVISALLVAKAPISAPATQDETPKIVLNPKFWTCTKTYQMNHAARSGTLTRFGRIGERDAYTSEECSQYSAKQTWSQP